MSQNSKVNQSPHIHVVIPAAGKGSRLSSQIPKQYLPLAGKPIIQYSLELFCEHPKIKQVMVVLSKGDNHWATLKYQHKKITTCTGGEERCNSVLNGINALFADSKDWVLVHDAARPLLMKQNLDELIATLMDDPIGGILATPVIDTLKLSNISGKEIQKTVSRQSLWQAQTPQMFRYEKLKEALSKSASEIPTDEAQAVELQGGKVRIISATKENFKITTQEDLKLAEAILKYQ